MKKSTYNLTELLLAHTVANGGNVVVPSYAYGAVWDLLDQLHTFLGSQGLHNIPVYFVSPASEFLFAYSTIIGEWYPYHDNLSTP